MRRSEVESPRRGIESSAAWGTPSVDLLRALVGDARLFDAYGKLSARAPNGAVSKFMGHASITITIDRYGHLLPGGEAEATALLDDYQERQRGRD